MSESLKSAVIKFLTLEKQPENNTHECLVNVYRDSALNVGEHCWKMIPELDSQLR